MKTDDKIRDEKITLREKQQKYLHSHLVKLIKMKILQGKKYYLPIKVEQ